MARGDTTTPETPAPRTGTPFAVTLLQMPVTTGGYVTINPAAVVALTPGNGPTCTVVMMGGINYTLGCDYNDAYTEITGAPPTIPQP